MKQFDDMEPDTAPDISDEAPKWKPPRLTKIISEDRWDGNAVVLSKTPLCKSRYKVESLTVHYFQTLAAAQEAYCNALPPRMGEAYRREHMCTNGDCAGHMGQVN